MKQCRKCKAVLALSEFYKHPQTGDGYLNHCKKCKCSYASKQYEIGRQNPDWVAKERKRTRERNIRLKYWEKNKHKKRSVNRKWLTNNPEKRTAHLKAYSALKSGKLIKKDCEICAAKKETTMIHMHHADYSRPLDVVFLCTTCHKKLHRKTP